MFKKLETPKKDTLEILSSEFCKLTDEQLSKLFDAIPSTVVTLDLSGFNKSTVQHIKKTLDDAGITAEGQVRSEESAKPK